MTWPLFAGLCSRCGAVTAMENGAYGDCPDCHGVDTVHVPRCASCENPFTLAQWDDRHRTHAPECAVCETHFGVCSCPPLDVHCECCTDPACPPQGSLL